MTSRIVFAMFATILIYTANTNAQAQSLYGPNCPGYAARSPASNAKVNVTFINRTPFTQQIYWVDFNGRLKLYRTLGYNQQYTQSTYKGHIWLVWNGNSCNHWFAASRNETWTLR